MKKVPFWFVAFLLAFAYFVVDTPATRSFVEGMIWLVVLLVILIVAAGLFAFVTAFVGLHWPRTQAATQWLLTNLKEFSLRVARNIYAVNEALHGR